MTNQRRGNNKAIAVMHMVYMLLLRIAHNHDNERVTSNEARKSTQIVHPNGLVLVIWNKYSSAEFHAVFT